MGGGGATRQREERRSRTRGAEPSERATPDSPGHRRGPTEARGTPNETKWNGTRATTTAATEATTATKAATATRQTGGDEGKGGRADRSGVRGGGA